MTRLQTVAMAALVLCWAGASVAAEERAHVLTVEAEEYSAMEGLRVIERAEASGGLTVSYWEEPGTWLELEFDVPAAGEYLISLRYALNWADTRRVVLLGGEELGEIELAGTGSWGDFETITLPFGPLELPAGTTALRLVNRDSRGLSLDWAALHAPEAPLGDYPLSEEQREELMSRVIEVVGPDARRILSFGQVELHGTGAGGPAWARVGEHLLVTRGAPAADRGPLMRRRTAHHQIALVGGGPEDGWLLVAITDGTSLHLVALADEGGEFALPAPVLGAGDVRVVNARAADGASLHLPAGDWRHRTERIEAGGLHISAAPGVTLRPWDEQGPAPGLSLHTTVCATGHVGAVRFSERWGSEQPRVMLEKLAAACVVRETEQRHPTLAAFYDEGMFDLHIVSDGALIFDDLRSGETLVLREGR